MAKWTAAGLEAHIKANGVSIKGPPTSKENFYRVANRAFFRDSDNNVYEDETLMLALLLHAKGSGRSADNEREVAILLDDPNQD